VAAIDGSLQKLGLEYVDMMIIHSPQPWTKFREGEHYSEGNREAWRALEDAYNAGKLRAIGVSNFEEVDLDNILDNFTVHPMVNQILVHISNTPLELIEYAQSKGILVETYSPVAHGELLKNKEVSAISERYGVSIAQLCVRYCLQLGTLPLPKTTNPEYMRENAAVDFEISGEDMERLKNIERINDKFPLKRHLYCIDCGQPLTAYIAKGRFVYYKCNTIGCCKNYSGEMLHNQYSTLLRSYSIPNEFKPTLLCMNKDLFYEWNQLAISQQKQFKTRITEIENKLQTAQVKFGCGEIEKIYMKPFAMNMNHS